ncbi:alpha/beta fold hydrolase (plasmid) [Streptomyces sp. NBC_00335]|uniref:thioesterase II family protein n=1 Tax=unclassified Streptomyces TaxID=2593676 RepID=UPI00224F6E3C|nr:MULTISPECIES: alpha/beta fold hydrolase [unclassified Streptomyces]MCX5410117.1 alpha/beta fold hydrolase [Streptomyces sp. NBC_00086]
MPVLKTPTASAWLRVFAPRPAARTRLFCFPHAGGGASAFRELAEAAPPELEVVAVQYPGRQDRFDEPPVTDMAVMLRELARAIEPWLDLPAAFFGHSMGATLAFETARLLRPRHPSAVVRLFASARKAPHIDTRDRLPLPDDEAVLAYVRRLGGTGAGLLEIPELRELTLPTLRGDFRLLTGHRYAPGAPLTCPLTVVTGTDDASCTPQDAAAWARHTVAGHEVHTFPGGHFYLEGRAGELMDFLTGRLGLDPAGDRHA